MTIRDRIIRYLQRNQAGIDDDQIARDLGLPYRQQANARCRELEREGLITRRKIRGKIHNFWAGPPGLPSDLWKVDDHDEKAWHWEGNVQAKIVNQLVSDAYDVLSVSDTARRQRGKDIMAVKFGNLMWVTVKGFPTGTRKTHPSTQAGHWFKQAVFDVIEYRAESGTADLAIGLPDFDRYRDLATRITWLKKAARFSFYWVRQDGSVVVE